MTEFERLRDDFLAYLELELNRRPTTIDGYRKDLKSFFRYLREKGIQDIEEITPQLLSEYIQYLAYQRNYKPRSQARSIATLRTFFEFLKSEEFVTDNPAIRLRSPRLPRNLPKFLTKDEVTKLIAAADDGTVKGKKNMTMLAVLFYTGIRLIEIISLKLEDIAKDLSTLEVMHGKGDKYRILPIHPELKQLLQHYLEKIRQDKQSPYLFNGERGEQLSASTVRLMVKDTAQKAGLKSNVTPHVLRHSIATCLAQTEGVDILDISKFLGHSKLTTTKIYLHTDLRYLRTVVERLPVIMGDQEKDKIS